MEAVPTVTYPATPSGFLREAAFWLERARENGRRPSALRTAARVWDALSDQERADVASGRGKATGIGTTSMQIIVQALAGGVPDYVAQLRGAARPLTAGGAALRRELRGDFHCHTDASDGSVPLAEMAQVAADLGHEYLLVTDHSPRLKVARGLDAQRVAAQSRLIDELNVEASLRILKGSEVDILADGSLDHDAATLAALDLVVASVHSHLRMDSESMTLRMVAAIANPRVNVLGHCTGRLVTGERGTRAPSDFDAEVVFEACRQFNVAVEINSRPERCDPPDELLRLAVDTGCLFAIDTDAHAPGQLDFQWYGCERAEVAGIPASRIVNTWSPDDIRTFASL